MTQAETLNTNPKTNATTIQCLSANEMNATHHMRHIFTLIDQIMKNYSSHATIC